MAVNEIAEFAKVPPDNWDLILKTIIAILFGFACWSLRTMNAANEDFKRSVPPMLKELWGQVETKLTEARKDVKEELGGIKSGLESLSQEIRGSGNQVRDVELRLTQADASLKELLGRNETEIRLIRDWQREINDESQLRIFQEELKFRDDLKTRKKKVIPLEIARRMRERRRKRSPS